MHLPLQGVHVFTPGFQSPESILDFQLRLRAAAHDPIVQNFSGKGHEVSLLSAEKLAAPGTRQPHPACSVCAPPRSQSPETESPRRAGSGEHIKTFLWVSRITQVLLTRHRTEAAAGPRLLNQSEAPTETTGADSVDTDGKAAYATEGSLHSASVLNTLRGLHCSSGPQSPVLWGLEIVRDLQEDGLEVSEKGQCTLPRRPSMCPG